MYVYVYIYIHIIFNFSISKYLIFIFRIMSSIKRKGNIKISPTYSKRGFSRFMQIFAYDNIKLDILLNNKISKRPFSSTPSRKGDPLGFVVAAFSSPYAPSFLSNPLGTAFILLMGMAVTLFFLISSLPAFLASDPSYVLILQRVDSICLLLERFIPYEQNGVAILMASINNFTPETLNYFYLSLQELLTAREALFPLLSELVNSPEIEFLEPPVVDRINQNLEDFRLGGNNLMRLIRDIEGRLNIPEGERIPPFWFEE
jgi:hypothetical protein